MQGIDDYEILETLHESANSLVLRARGADRVRVILKVLKKDYPSPVELTRYRQEYEVTRSLSCEHVIVAHGLRKHQNTLIMALEDFGGESLARVMRGRRLAMREILEIATQLTRALGEVHAHHVVHKDINPSNVVWNPGTGQLKLIDFGIATRLSRENPVLGSPEVLEGTLAYMSPEQTGRTSRSMDYRTDFYSLGATLYQLATGRLPFPTEDPVELVHNHIAREVVPAHELEPEVPVVLSRIIGKLLAKAAEERYQSAHGLLHDLAVLERVLAGEPVEEGEGFEPGRHDASERFGVPQKLYGRQRELATVLETFRRVSDGRSELLLIGGYSGVGKTALIQEVYEPITERRGYFAGGKFDQLQRNVPFSGLVGALRDLVRQLLTESEERLVQWRHRLAAAFGANGQVIVDVIPDLELIVGPQEPVPELSSAEAMNRFNLVFPSFIRVFCGGGRPLVLFLDDLQWADSATLQLIELLLTDEGTENLLLIGAYRDNEVDALHPLTDMVERLRQGGATIGRIELLPLALGDLQQLVADTLHRGLPEVQRLAELVLAKTRGNPFFVMQFLEMLYRDHLVTRAGGRWEWDITRIEAAGITDNVVDLMIDKVRRLPEATQQALRLAACVGNRFDLETLALVHHEDPARTFQALLPALEEGLVLPVSGLEALDPAEPMSPLLIRHYRFQHDRVQQSAYSLLGAEEGKAIHLEIGRRLLATMSPKRLAERVFDVVDHLDLGRELIVDPAERRRLAELNLEAGKKAKESTAYVAARQYLRVAHEALPADAWEVAYPLTLELHMVLAEVEYLNGDFERSEQLAALVLARAHTDLERAAVHAMLIVQYTLRTRFADAIGTGQTLLAVLGIELPLQDLEQHAFAMLGHVGQLLGDRPIASLYDDPDVADPRMRMAHVALRHLTIAAFLSNQALFPVVTALAVRLSLEHGNAPESALCYSNYGLILGAFMGRYGEGAQFGELGLRLCEKFHPHAPTATVCLVVGSELVPWVEHVGRSIPVLEQGWHVGLEAGDILWAGYLRMYKLSHECFMGKNIEAVLTGLPEALGFVQRMKNQGALNGMLAHQLVLSNLAGETRSRSEYAAGELDEAGFIALCEAHQSQMALCFLRILEAQAQYLYRQYAEALASTRAVDGKLNFIVNHVQLADHQLYQALALVALCPALPEDERAGALEQVRGNLAKLERWAASAPANYGHKHLLLAAELARLEGDPAAIDLYDRAIEGARALEFIQDQALGSELAARYWLGRNRKGRISQMYLRDARYAYDLWGAKRKVDELEAEFPDVFGGSSLAASLSAVTTTVAAHATTTTTTTTRMSGTDRLDLASVLKASQAISGEIALADLLRTMVRIVIENAGAQLGVIVLEKDGAWLIEAKGTVGEDEVIVRQGQPLDGSDDVCVAVAQYVINTKATVVLHDATRQGRFTADPYVVSHRPKSVLCTPILHQGRVSGVLYLENNLSEGTFTSDRLGVLRVLASQAAISIENATLYASLEAYNLTLEQKVEERTRDILRTQDQLVAQEKMAWMGTLSVGIAHEIKNPLNFINNFAEVSTELSAELLEELRAKQGQVLGAQDFTVLDELLADINGNMEKIRHYGRRADGIVESMKVLAEGGGKDPSEVDINSQVEELSNVVHHGRVAQGGSWQVHVRKDYDPGLGVQTVVPHGLGRVLVNLLNNAYDALEERRALEPAHEATLVIRTVNGDGWFEIGIRDNGLGIAAKHLPHIKAPFFTTKPAGSGHIGLGLSVSEDIVTLQHHGQLLVRTEAGEYAELTVRLPKDLGGGRGAAR
jgi:predicted ATPase/signal transduction histidine kinase/tRNA A-37 threonylcarbamoyl transferase component Bud32